MSSRYPIFDRSKLLVQPLAARKHDMSLADLLPLDATEPAFAHPQLGTVATRLAEARRRGAARILMLGAHVLKVGVSRQLVDLIERGWLTHLAFNGAGAIHDYELARIGASTESVARYIQTGEFGLWRETGDLNEWIREAAELGLGLGENAGDRKSVV